MLKLDLNTKKHGESELKVEGNTFGIIRELSEGVYKILRELDMENVSVKERIKLFEGGLLLEHMLSGILENE